MLTLLTDIKILFSLGCHIICHTLFIKKDTWHGWIEGGSIGAKCQPLGKVKLAFLCVREPTFRFFFSF